MEEKERNEILKKEAERSEKIRRRMEREERRRQRKQQRKNLDEEEMNKKIEIEERKLLVAQRKLESIRLLDELLERVKVIFSVFNMTASSSASSITTTLISMISPSAEVLIVSMEMVIASFHICRHKDWISLTFLNGRCIFYVENFSKLFLLHMWTFGDDKNLGSTYECCTYVFFHCCVCKTWGNSIFLCPQMCYFEFSQNCQTGVQRSLFQDNSMKQFQDATEEET